MFNFNERSTAAHLHKKSVFEYSMQGEMKLFAKSLIYQTIWKCKAKAQGSNRCVLRM